MTNNEIKETKAYLKYGIKCDIFKEPVLTYARIALEAFETIEIQKRELDRLYRENDRLSLAVLYNEGFIEEAKIEAIEEFANELKTKYRGNTTSITSLVTMFDNINKLVEAKRIGAIKENN